MRAIYYDTETTGVNTGKDRIIEIAAYDPKNNLSFEELVNPGCPIPPEATAIHHISDDMVADRSDFSVIGKKFVEFCEGDVVLIAHNNDNFDVHFLRHEFKRHGLAMPSWLFLDSLKWARRYRPDLPRHSLQFLREIFGIPSNNAHRALDDVIVLQQVFSLLIDDLEIEEVLRLINIPRNVAFMPFGKHQGKPLKEVPGDYVRWLSSSGAFEKSENKDLRTSFEKLGLLPALNQIPVKE
jgi:DNA polymerase-3 subunit epsilon